MSSVGSKRKRTHSDEDPKDGSYFEADREKGKKKARPGLPTSIRKQLEREQNLQLSEDGTHTTFDSAVRPGKKNKLDRNGKERIPQSDDARGRPRPDLVKRPAIDHKKQYALFKRAYFEAVNEAREDAKQGKERRSSVDYAQAFRDAHEDVSNLRLVTKEEHDKYGKTLRADEFTETQVAKAKRKLLEFLPRIKASSKREAVFAAKRPDWSPPLPDGQPPPQPTVRTRSRTAASESPEFTALADTGRRGRKSSGGSTSGSSSGSSSSRSGSNVGRKKGGQ
ncbi:hypothetical protein [Andreprevotia chitinilytica]|uniref:hypothetical protein n=1 Tax=Andreprevotia chitinilytica TaxID=396808 RepID=UPI000555FEE3|nr:hypothetical protein [Andreprevotia chitinilytica]